MRTEMRRGKIRWLVTAGVILLNLAWWLVPGNVDYLVVQNREVLLGRYSVDRFTAMVIVMLLCWPALYLVWAGRDNIKKRSFKVIAVLIGVTAGVLLTDFALRQWRSPRYRKTEDVYHRPPDTKVTGVFRDVPERGYSYPNVLPGHPDVPYTLTVDSRGFRNRTDLGKYDVLILGDSFAEGSGVSNEQVWAALYAAESGRAVYNLGMSGGNPITYVETLEKFGLRLSPDIVMCMLYEGNDLKGSDGLFGRVKKRTSLKRRLRACFKTSPVRLVIKQFFIDTFSGGRGYREEDTGPEKAGGGNQVSDALSWLPLAIPEGPGAKHYAFQLKRLQYHYEDGESFAKSDGCKTALLALEKLREMCRENNARLIVVYIPDKPHVVMPLVKERLEADKIRGFLALKLNDLPTAPETKSTLYANLGAREKVVEDFCRREGIDFISTTGGLRDAVGRGGQAYYTYNQHWSPLGHRIVADMLYAYLEKQSAGGKGGPR